MGHYADSALSYFWKSYGRSTKSTKRGFQRGSGKSCWRTSTGVISMTTISTDHLHNARKICIKTNNSGKLKEINEEILRRQLL